jgi:hypothetical protein
MCESQSGLGERVQARRLGLDWAAAGSVAGKFRPEVIDRDEKNVGAIL